MVREIDAHLLCPSSSWLGECPLWRPETSEILWVDIQGKRFFRRKFKALTDSPSKKSPLKEKTVSYPLPEVAGSFCMCDDGRLIFAFKGGLAFYDPEEGVSSLQRIAEFEPELPTRMNDGRVDPQGRFVVGGYDAHEPDKLRSAIYRLNPDNMSVEKVLDGVACANSICFSRNHAPDCTMYFTDSFASPRTIYKVEDYGRSGGTVHRRTPFVKWGGKEDENGPFGKTLPDGSVLDSAGRMWNAQFGKGRVVRYDEAGNVDFIIKVPVPHVTCLAFGGPDLRHIFITNASKKILSASDLAKFPEGYPGGLFVARLPEDMPSGVPEYKFGRSTAKEWRQQCQQQQQEEDTKRSEVSGSLLYHFTELVAIFAILAALVATASQRMGGLGDIQDKAV